jgi:hypothetical protein
MRKSKKYYKKQRHKIDPNFFNFKPYVDEEEIPEFITFKIPPNEGEFVDFRNGYISFNANSEYKTALEEVEEIQNQLIKTIRIEAEENEQLKRINEKNKKDYFEYCKQQGFEPIIF